ncbi:MAG: hypothetical protein AABZ15_10090 [Nitrospirota bacterium]
MKKYTAYVSVVLLFVVLSGCGASAKMTQTKSQSERTDVFTEVSDVGARPQGFADMIVKANIKTHAVGYYLGESGKSLHGKPGYPFVLNIDGHALVWKVDGQKDAKPAYDKDGKTSLDPEAGDGMKYVLEKKLRLRPGTHKVFFGLPQDEYHVEAEIALRDGEEAALEFKPVYRYKIQPTRIPTFLEGINKYEIYFNGVKIK